VGDPARADGNSCAPDFATIFAALPTAYLVRVGSVIRR